MKQFFSLKERVRDSRGATVLWVALLVAVFVSFAALAIDIGYAAVVRNELQNVSDAGALAGARQLGATYDSMTIAQQQVYVCDPSTITPPVISVAAQNKAGNVSISVPAGDISIGKWTAGTKTFTADLNQPDAVMVTARRDSVANGPVTTFFAGVFGVGTLDARAPAIAALTGIPNIDEGGLPLPLGISTLWFTIPRPGGFCGTSIATFPTNLQNCAGWHTFKMNSNSSNMKKIVDVSNNFQSPAVSVGESLEFYGTAGGTLFSNGKEYLRNLFDAKKVLNDGVIDRDSDSTTWTTSVVVYKGDCNPSGGQEIAGFATFIVTAVSGPSEKTLYGRVLCDYVENRGGGGAYGTRGTIPGLVR